MAPFMSYEILDSKSVLEEHSFILSCVRSISKGSFLYFASQRCLDRFSACSLSADLNKRWLIVVPNNDWQSFSYTTGQSKWQCHTHSMSRGAARRSCAWSAARESQSFSYRRLLFFMLSISYRDGCWLTSAKNSTCASAASTRSTLKVSRRACSMHSSFDTTGIRKDYIDGIPRIRLTS